MKIKEGFILRKVGIQYVVAAIGKASENFDGMMRLNESGAFLFEHMKENTTTEQLVKELMEEYDIDENIAKEGVQAFLNGIREADAVEEP